jgi:hypothetical protein
VRELRRLVRFRQQLADRRRDVKLRIGATLRELRLTTTHTRWGKPWMKWVATLATDESTRWVLDEHLLELEQLRARIGLAEQRLERKTADDPIVRRLLEQPGIGPVTAWVIRAEVGRFAPLHPRQAVVALLRADALQRLQRRPPGGPRPGPRRQPDAQEYPHRSGPSPGAARATLANALRPAAGGGQTRVRGVGGGRQPLDAHAVPPDETTGAGDAAKLNPPRAATGPRPTMKFGLSNKVVKGNLCGGELVSSLGVRPDRSSSGRATAAVRNAPPWAHPGTRAMLE